MNLFSIIFALFSLFNQTPHAGFGHYAVARPMDTIGGGPLTPVTPAPAPSPAATLAKPMDTIGGGPLTATPAPTTTTVAPNDTIGGGPLPK